jgi:threonylcarbamoyladenosine tRNA methylthiotransferase MtaB
MMDYKFQMHTFGCKVNTYDSGLIQKNLAQFGLSMVRQDPQIHVLNTCAVTAEATKEAVKTIRRIKAQSPLSTVVVTGCAAQVDTEHFQNLPGADLVVANSHKGLLPQILDQYFKGTLKEKVFKSNIFRKEDLEIGGGKEQHHTRSFLKIQDGCNSFCSFCIIPYARGKSRSIPIKTLVEKVNELTGEGLKEVVLTGVHIGDYEDGTLRLEDLVESILEKTSIARIRLTSLEPIELSARLLSLYQNPRLLPHFHMSIQSANTQVLKDMKRNYGQKEVLESLNLIQKHVPQAFVGMDVIAGFPTETEEDFLDTFSALAEAPWTRLHVFPYSERKGTRAEVMAEKVPLSVRAERAQKLRELSLHRFQSLALQQVGKIKTVLVQNKPSKGGHGLSEDYWNVKIESETPLTGNTLVQVKILGLQPLSDWMEPALLGKRVLS